LHILLIAGWYPNPNTSVHHGIFIKRHAKAIALKHQVTLLHIYPGNKNERTILKSENFTELLISYKKSEVGFAAFKFVSAYQKLKKIFLNYFQFVVDTYGKPDVIHHHILFPQGIFSAMLSKKFNIPLVVSEQWSGYLPEDNSYQNFITKYFTEKTIAQSSAITTVSKVLMNAMKHVGLQGNYFVVPNIVDLEIFKLNDIKKSNEVCKIIHVSSLNDKEKNIVCLLKSLKLVQTKGYNFKLNIIGDSHERANFELLTEELNLSHSVHFLGQKHPTELANYYKESDFFVLSSNYETFCVVLIEALVCGLPVVATNVGAVGEIINESNGLLAQSNNTESLADKIIEMIHSYKNYDGRTLRNSVAEKFTENIVAEKFEEIYFKITGNK
jgi:glycosyltransferase involved in cell wall biosynthesis